MSHFTNPETCREGQPADRENRLSVYGILGLCTMAWIFLIIGVPIVVELLVTLIVGR